MKAHFFRKACTIEELKDIIGRDKGSEYTIEETVELEQAEYERFTKNLLDDFDFIAQRKDKMWMDGNKVWHCLLVKAKGAEEGILVESEGYDYARYAAFYEEAGGMTDKLLEQILAIRSDAKCNMFDTVGVQREANEKGFYELVIFLEEHKKEYAKFILTGERKQ